MSSSWTLILLFLTILSSSIGDKLPLLNQPFLTGPHSREEYSRSPLVWKWETQDKSDKTLLTLIRMARDISDKKTTDLQPDVKYPSKDQIISKLPLEKFTERYPHILLTSEDPDTETQTMAHLSEDETTPLSELDHTSTEGETLKGAETTQTDNSLNSLKFPSTQEQLSTPNPTNSTSDVSVFKKITTSEATTFDHIDSTSAKLPSSIPDSTSNTMVEETMSVGTSKIPNDTPFKPIVTSTEPTTQDNTTGWMPSSKGSSMTPVPVTHISTTSEDKIHTQALMKQCMLTILILAVLCTIFIITTIALAAKLSTLRHRQKLRHPATYTEMRCISSLLPESDQQNKVKPKRLKTFATMEESDGDNTTLNSFLPDH